MGGVLPADDDAVSRKLKEEGLPSNIDVKRERKLYAKQLREQAILARKAYHKRKKPQRRDSRSRLVGKYMFKKAWLYRKAAIDPKQLQRALASDVELRELQKQYSTPRHQVRRKLQRLFLDREIPRINAKILKLQAEIEPIVEQILVADRKMRSLMDQKRFILWQGSNIRAPSKASIRHKIKRRIEKIKIGQCRQSLARDANKLRREQGFWIWLKQKSAPVFREDGRNQGTFSLTAKALKNLRKESHHDTDPK